MLLLSLQDGGDFLLAGHELGENPAKFRHKDGHKLVEEGILRIKAEDAAEAHSAAENVADDIVSPAVAGFDPVGDGEADSADVIADDAISDVDLLLFGKAVALAAFGDGRGIGLAGELGKLREDRGEDVSVVVRGESGEIGEALRALDDSAGALETHPRVDVAGGERTEGAVFVRVELDEDEVPDLDAAGVAHVDEAAFGVSIRGQVEVDLGAGTAGPGLAHHPEVVLAVAIDDVHRGIESGLGEDRSPEIVGLLVEFGRIALRWCVDRRVEAVRGHLPAFRQQLPGPGDRLDLEVIAEGPVPQHLEKGVVIGIVADIIKVVVLASGADAFLRIGGPRRIVGSGLGAEEIGNELVHPRVREEQVR